MKICVIFLFVFQINFLQAQKIKSDNLKTVDTCFLKLLTYQVKTSGYLFIPALTPLGENFTLKIKSNYLFNYLQLIDTTSVDSINYIIKLDEIYSGTKKLVFDNTLFEKLISKNGFVFLESNNFYTDLIKTKGLNYFQKKYFKYGGKLNAQTETYSFEYDFDLFNQDKFNLIYLEAALFKFNYLMSKGDQVIFLTKYIFCP